jgi:hypothetical protein
LALNAVETEEDVSAEARSTIRAEAIGSCLAGRPARYQLEQQIQRYEKYCGCNADYFSQNITGRDIAEYERNKGVIAGELMGKAEAAMTACKADFHK